MKSQSFIDFLQQILDLKMNAKLHRMVIRNKRMETWEVWKGSKGNKFNIPKINKKK